MTAQVHLQGDSSHIKRWIDHQPEVSLQPSPLTQGELRSKCRSLAMSPLSPGRRGAWALVLAHLMLGGTTTAQVCLHFMYIYTFIFIYIYLYIFKSILANILISILTSVTRHCVPHVPLYSLSLSTHHIHIYSLKVNSEEEREREETLVQRWTKSSQNLRVARKSKRKEQGCPNVHLPLHRSLNLSFEVLPSCSAQHFKKMVL